MTMKSPQSARLLAGAFLLLASAAPARAAEPLKLALERPGGPCEAPAAGTALGLLPLTEKRPDGAGAAGCVVEVSLAELTDEEIDGAAARLTTASSSPALILRIPAAEIERTVYAIKRLASSFRAASLEGRIGLDSAEPLPPEADEELAAYVDALVLPPGGQLPAESARAAWLLAPASETASPIAAVLGALLSAPAAALVAVPSGGRAVTDADATTLSRLQRYFTGDVSPDPTATTRTRRDGSTAAGAALLRRQGLHADPVPAGRSGRRGAHRALGRPVREGVGREPHERRRAATSSSRARPSSRSTSRRGPLAVVLTPAARAGAETKAAVDVGATRGLTADEIVARERGWEAGQRERVRTYTALMESSLRFRVASLPGSIDLTIRGPYFFERGQAPDWSWEEFYLNGVRWKGRTIPKLPILQPDKVTTLPLDIRLTEEYEYELAGETTVDERPAYRVDFRPRSTVGDKPIYRGTAWIDRETFALLRRESIQLNLKGDTLSNVQTEYYRDVPDNPGLVLPLEIRGQQVFSTAGRTTAIERRVTMTGVRLNPEDYAERLKEAYASKSQMVRDTDDGLRYLVPDPEKPEERQVENKLTRKSLIGVVGAFYQRGQDYPFPLLGLQYFNFDMWGKNKQLSVFFFGSILFANYTDPSFLGTHFDLGADAFGVAIPFVETEYRNGIEFKSGSVKHLPEYLSLNMGHPIGPYLKASLIFSSQYDGYKATDDTSPDFVVPVDTFTLGAGLRLNWNQDGYNIAANAAYFSRSNWEPWGVPVLPHVRSGPEELLEVLGRGHQGLLLCELPEAPGQAVVPGRRQPRSLVAVGLRAVLGKRVDGVSDRHRARRPRLRGHHLVRHQHPGSGPLRARVRPGARHEPLRRRQECVLLGHRDHHVVQRPLGQHAHPRRRRVSGRRARRPGIHDQRAAAESLLGSRPAPASRTCEFAPKRATIARVHAKIEEVPCAES